ncbi:MAG: Serine/threonine-protein kinase D1 [Marteilia pararefringens]
MIHIPQFLPCCVFKKMDTLIICHNNCSTTTNQKCCNFEELQSLYVYNDHQKYLLKLEFVYHTFYVLRQQTVSDEQIALALNTIHYCFEPYRCAKLSRSMATICCFQDCPFNDRFRIDTNSVLGSGQFGVVYSAKDLIKNEVKAIKVLKSRKPMKELKKEYFINAQLDCVNVIRIEAMGTDSVGTVMICMELAGIDYLDFILKVNGGKLNEDMAKFYTFQLLNGLLYLHQNDIIHRDIKPENLLLEPGVSEQRLYGLMKIADFGMSNFITFGMRSTKCGSQQYQAPEIINGIMYDTRADIWAMGVVHYASIVGCYPFIQNEPRNYSHIEKKNAGLHLYSTDAVYFFREIFVDQKNRTRSHKLISSQYFRTRLETIYRSFSSLLSVEKNCYSIEDQKGISLLMKRLMR